MAAEAQTRFRRGGPGQGQPHRQTWCPISNVRQRAEMLATYPAWQTGSFREIPGVQG